MCVVNLKVKKVKEMFISFQWIRPFSYRAKVCRQNKCLFIKSTKNELLIMRISFYQRKKID